jgi:hypothetical protein
MTILQEDSERDQKIVASWKSEHFGSAFDLARKSYGFATALLLAWALIGIDLQPDVLSNYKITLKSPQAAPWVLVAAVLYFAFRFTIEWFQTDPARRGMPASRVDYYAAHGFGLIAFLIFFGQKLWQKQLADALVGRTQAAVIGVVLGIALTPLLSITRRVKIRLLILVFLFAVQLYATRNDIWALVGSIISFTVSTFLITLVSVIRERKR